MQANYVQRLRGTFGKDGPARFIGHLDLVKTIERALIRAQIPLAYTQGFNPQPRMQFASALPLGYTSECEIVDFWLSEIVDPNATLRRLNNKMAPGIVMHTLNEEDLSSPKLQTLTRKAQYLAVIKSEVFIEEIKEGVDKILTSEEIIRIRRDKSYDLRPLILDMHVEQNQSENILLFISMSHTPSLSGRPDDVLTELGLDPLGVKIHRRELILAD